jgi:hypothetical protein
MQPARSLLRPSAACAGGARTAAVRVTPAASHAHDGARRAGLAPPWRSAHAGAHGRRRHVMLALPPRAAAVGDGNAKGTPEFQERLQARARPARSLAPRHARTAALRLRMHHLAPKAIC